MARGFLPGGAATALDAVVAGHPWLQLHVGDPGAAGTANVATETTRKQVSWNATGTDGIVENSTGFSWTNIAGSQDATDLSTWSASVAGSGGFTGTIAANPYTAGDTYSVAAGALTASVPLAS